MYSGFDFTPRWRIAFTALLLCALTGGVVFRIVTSRGPSWVFFAISAGVLALVAIDMWDKLRAAPQAAAPSGEIRAESPS